MENTESFQSDCANSNDLNLPSESNKQINSDDRPTNQCLFCGQGYKKLPSLTSHLRNCEFAKSNCEGSEGPTAFEDSTSSGIGLLPNQCVFCKQSFEELHLLITHLPTCDQAKGSWLCNWTLFFLEIHLEWHLFAQTKIDHHFFFVNWSFWVSHHFSLFSFPVAIALSKIPSQLLKRAQKRDRTA